MALRHERAAARRRHTMAQATDRIERGDDGTTTTYHEIPVGVHLTLTAEWDYLRVVCVKCGEQRFDALPVFTAEQYPQARVDACDTCRTYLKTLDATKDGRVVPVVDDLATVALDLWAREQGYVRVRTNLVRI